MSGGMPVYFGQPESQPCAPRGMSGRPATAPFWPKEMDSMYAGPLCVDGASMVHHAEIGIAPSQSVPQPGRAEMRSAGAPVDAQAGVIAIPFPRPVAVHQLDCLRPEPVSDLRRNPQGLRNGDTTSRDLTEVPGLCYPPTNKDWEDVVRMSFATSRTCPALPLQVHSRWDPSAKHPLITGSDMSSVGPIPPHNAEDDDDVYTLLCEWTDKHGTCNMTVFGDRVWMSHHLSRQHNVVGHEKSQRACLWRGCMDTMNKGSLARHVVSRHLRAGASCGFCSKVYSRADVARRHTKKCKVANEAKGHGDQTKW